MAQLSGLSVIANRYDALLLDLWGVIHDGTHLYPGVHGALTELRKAGKKIVMLSNAPRRAWKVEKVLNDLGVESGLYEAVVSSGEVGFQWLAQHSPSPFQGEGGVGVKPQTPEQAANPHPNPPPERGRGLIGKRYFYIGPPKDLDVADGLNFTRVDAPVDADMLLNVGFGSEEQHSDDWMPLLRDAQRIGLPMVCLNPDLEVVKQTGERFECAGVLAHAYESFGGKVHWFGKPYPAVYEECLNILFPSPSQGEGRVGVKQDNPHPDPLPKREREKERVLAIGDSLDTDIPGAQNFGIDSVLVTGGILKTQTSEQIAALCEVRSLLPTYIMPQLAW